MKRWIALTLGIGLALALGSLGGAQVEVLPRIERDVSYGLAGGETLKMDIYRPQTSGRKPAVITIHGGGWRAGDKRGDRRLALLLAKQDYVVFAINYRLTPKFPWPAAFDDCQRAVRWVRHQADEYEVKRSRIGALGRSAGAHLAALLGTVRETRDDSDPLLAKYSSQVNAVVDMYGPADLRKQYAHARNKQTMLDFMGKPPQQAQSKYRAASPALQVTRKSAPFLILHGSADPVVPVEQAKLMDAALRAKGVPSKLVIIEGAGHGWRRNPSAKAQSDREIIAFLETRLRKGKRR